ncbi:hypothetical protein Dda_6548 [Drechslerella dactyloides]|uniref:Uncharacterized protein n=1 Tax=Drechslerella dactyloides TaxID=74499 RepID=A0AAD6NHI4_DREDA|nr:hypothetical protein Dda_6548 [Drechslerella dactyloides]
MLLDKVALAITLAISANTVQAVRDEVAYSDGLHDLFDPGFLEDTRPAEHVIKKWRGNLIPEGCKERFTDSSVDPKDMEAYNVTYTQGCQEPWVFCRERTAQLSVESMASLFGRLPLHMRELVRHPIAVKDTSCSAFSYTDIGDILFKGDCSTPSVWIHETGHQMDAALNLQNDESGSEQWMDAVSKDTCVPDDYANTNNIEDFAQVTVTALYQSIRGYIPTSYHPGCFDNQLSRLLRVFRARYMTYSLQCTGKKIPPSENVSKDGKMSTRRAAVTARKVVGPCRFH